MNLADDLGVLGDLAKALGLLEADGSPNGDWFGAPGSHLSQVLSDDDQRAALVSFVDEVLGGPTATTADGATWLPVVEVPAPRLSLFVVLDERSDRVVVGVGARLVTSGPDSRTSVHVPVFQVARGAGSLGNPIALGTQYGRLALETEVTLADPSVGSPSLRAVRLKVGVPTDGTAPTIALTLAGLLLPGTPGPRDVSLDVDDLDELDDAVRDLLLGLLTEQAAVTGGAAAALAGMLGLSGGGVPVLPLDQLASAGPAALKAWFAQVVSTPASRDAWLGHLAGLVGGAVDGGEVAVTLGGVQVRLGIRSAPGPDGQPLVTVTAALQLAASGVAARVEADLVQVSLGGAGVVALPRLEIAARAGRLQPADPPLLTGDVEVGAVRLGVALDGQRRPILVLAADGVRVGTTPYATVDLSSPEALAEVGTTVLSAVVDELIGRLGPLGDVVRVLLGVTPPAGFPAAPTLDLPDFVRDPVGAVTDRWRALLDGDPLAVRAVLTPLRDALADAGVSGEAVDGRGTVEDPWRIPLVGPVALRAWRPAEDRLAVGLAASYATTDLGHGCTEVATTAHLTLAELDLAGRSGAFLGTAGLDLVITACDPPGPLRLEVDELVLTADRVELSTGWRAGTGVDVRVAIPGAALGAPSGTFPLPLPEVGADGSVTFTDWDALEGPLAAIAAVAAAGWLDDLVALFGWAGEVTGPRLRLADLVADPDATLRAWLVELALSANPDVLARAVGLLGRLLGSRSGASGFGLVTGTGTPTDPYLVHLAAGADVPALAVWWTPDGPTRRPVVDVPGTLRGWRPGDVGLPPATLEDALRRQAVLLDDVADLLRGRPPVADGLEALVDRWLGTDGLVAPPASPPAGVAVHRVPADHRRLARQLDLAEVLGGAPPATVVHLAVDAPGSWRPPGWPEPPDDRLVDLRAAGLSPESFTVPAGATGEWFVLLGGRAACRLSSGDSDGVLGQTARLRRIVDAQSGPVAVVAYGAAGHAALRAAHEQPGVASLVTVGTPLTPVTFAVVDSDPAGDTLRLLRQLLPVRVDPEVDPEEPPPPDDDDLPAPGPEPDDDDLAAGRALVDGLAALTRIGDPGGELGLPATTDAASGGLPEGFPRAGLDVHAVFGTLPEDELLRALTAVVAAGLAERARRRTGLPTPAPTEMHLGLRVPLRLPGTGAELAVDGHLLLGLLDVADGGTGALSVTPEPRAELRLGLGRGRGWLVGGPDPGRTPGSERETELRRVSLRVGLPLAGQGDGAGSGGSGPGGDAGDRDDSAALVLHEVRCFEIERERWVVGPEGLTDPVADAVTAVLPEVRVVLSRLAERIAPPGAGTAGPALGALLRAAGLLDASGGFLPDGVDDLVHDPLGHVGGLDLTALVGALRGLVPSDTGAPGDPVTIGPLTVVPDLAAGSVAVTLTAPEGLGALPWSATALVGRTGATATLRLGGDALRLEVGGPPVTAALVLGDQRLPLDQVDPDQLLRLIARAVPAEVVRLVLDALRELDDTARPVVDAALGALGLLGETGRALAPVGLLTDPSAWLRATLGGGPSGLLRADRVAALLDALRPLVGVPGDPGSWTLATGVALAVTPEGDRVRLGLTVDSGAFTDPGGARLALGGSAALLLSGDAPPGVAVSAHVGRAGAAVAGREAVHLGVSTGAPVSLLLRPAGGPDVVLLPGGPGLGSLAQAGVAHLLPLVLDSLAAEDGADLAGDVGRTVAAVGDALALRTGAAPTFDGERLLAWGDPAAALAAAWPTLAGPALDALAAALQPVLQRALGAAAVSVVDGALRLSVQRVTVTLDPAPFSVSVLLDVPSLDVVGRVRAAVTLDATGLRALEAEVGPATVDLGGVELAPYLGVRAGSAPAGGRSVEAGLGLGGSRTVLARWVLGGSFGTLVRDGAVEDPSPAAVALALVEAVLDVVGAVALASAEVAAVLAKPVGSRTVGQVLEGVLLEPGTVPHRPDDDLFDLARVLERVTRLARNLAQAGPRLTVGGLELGLGDVAGAAGVTIAVAGRFDLPLGGDVVLSIENDATWISPAVPAGLTLGLVDLTDLAIRPALVVGGLGLRIAGTAGPLLDTGIQLDSVALHGFAKVSAGETSGGAQLQLAGLGIALGGASGGNPVASGLMSETGSGGQQLAPRFSPALAVQKHGTGPVRVSLSAGPGSGPWWLVIQRGFGPVYVEQVGLAVTVSQDQLQRIGILLDGRVSIFGLTAAVDDLQIACVLTSPGAPWTADSWTVDLAGLAIDADLGGLVLQGGLRKFSSAGGGVEYVGMLLARFAVYGLSVYGGYGRTVDAQGPFASFFAFGAVVGPIGGPPAFFVTGIGGGLGINRRLVVPTDLSQFGQYPLIKALDPGAAPSGDPMAELERVRETFPAQRGTFWFAGGISFTSFALVDGVAVVAIQVGDGFEISLLGLARMALPRPQLALVSIELALVARFSTREGVLWVQAQLTDNSWLLYPDVRLTGGFAYVLWFAGPRRGEFVLTIGGYHPEFRRDGYPQVPRLGMSWRYGPVVVKGEAYFALTSEAVMAGVRIEASAKFGPAWAHLELGADGIIYFDPFHYKVTVYASISAGVTINVWIGKITIKIHIGARVTVEGPDFHAVAKFEVGPVSLTVEIGECEQEPERYLHWDDFVPKYLEAARIGVARTITAIPGRGAVPPQTPSGASRPDGPADGSPARPFEVLVEFEITVTSTAPLTRTEVGTAHQRLHPHAGLLGVAPMGKSSVTVVLRAELRTASGGFAVDPITGGRVDNAFVVTHRATGTYPKGIWGKPKSLESRAVPAGDLVPGVEGVTLAAEAKPGQRYGPYPYKRVEIRRRQPLPFVSEQQVRADFLATAEDVAAVIGAAGSELDPAVLLATAGDWLGRGARSRTSLASWAGERTTPPRLGTLTDRLAPAELPAPPLAVPEPPGAGQVDGSVHPPVAIAVLVDPSARLDLAAPRTTVARVPVRVPRTAPPSLPLVSATADPAVAARLVRVAPAAVETETTLVTAGAVPATGLARSGAEASAALGSSYDGVARLAALTAAISRTPKRPREQVRVGELAVLQLPNAEADLDADRRPLLVPGGTGARAVGLAPGGGVLLDTATPPSGAELTVPQGTERLAVVATGTGIAPGLAGWHSGQSLPYVGWSTVLGAGVVVTSEGGVAERDVGPVPTGWVQAAELVAGATLVSTRFATAVSLVVVAVDDPAGQLAGEAGTESRGLALGLSGATRRGSASGEALPPTALVTGGRTFLVYEVDQAEAAATVTVASGDGWRLAGVLGATASVAEVAGRLARDGLDTSVAPLVVGTEGSLRVGWLPAPDDDGVRRVPRRRR